MIKRANDWTEILDMIKNAKENLLCVIDKNKELLIFISDKFFDAKVLCKNGLKEDKDYGIGYHCFNPYNKDFYFIFCEKMAGVNVMKKGVRDFDGVMISISKTEGKVELKKEYNEEYIAYILNYYENYVYRVYDETGIKMKIANVRVVEETDQYTCGYKVKYEKQYTYPDGIVKSWSKYKHFYENFPKLYVAYDENREIIWEAESGDVNAEYRLSKEGCFVRRVKREKLEYVYKGWEDHNIFGTEEIWETVNKSEYYPEEPCNINEISESYDWNGDYKKEPFASVHQMYLHYKNEAGVLKAIDNFEVDKKRFYEEKMPEFYAQAETWIKDNF